jgi:hypothetical protein
MKVQINGRYAYETDLVDVEVGDEMLLPGSMSSDSWTGIVTALEPEYDGPCRRALGLTRRRGQVEAENEALAEVRITGWRAGETFEKACASCGQDREYVVKEVNNIGRPTSVGPMPCNCGAQAHGAYLGSAAAFRHFVIDPEL